MSTGVLARILVSAAKRYKSPIWEEFVAGIDRIQAGMGRRMGQFDQALNETGLSSLTTAQKELIRPAMEGKTVTDAVVVDVASKLRNILDTAHGQWISQGGRVKEVEWAFDNLGRMIRKTRVRPTGYVENYFPHQLKNNIAEILFEDSNAMFNSAKKSGIDILGLSRGKIDKMDAASREILEELVAKRMAVEGGFRRETNEAITYILARNPGMTPGQALRIIHNRASGHIFNPMGSLEKARRGTLPDNFYESSPIKVMRRYGHGWARRSSEAEEWGMDYSGLLGIMNRAGGNEARDMERIASFITGAGEYQVSREFRKWTNLYTEFEVATKIGLGTAVIPNISQPTISIIPKAGMLRVLRGVANWFTVEGNKRVHQSGVLSRGHTAMQALTGNWADVLSLRNLDLEGLAWYEKLSRITTTSVTTPFNWVNRMLNAVSAATGEVYIKDLYKIANKSGIRKDWAIKQLAELGVSHTRKLSKNKLLEGMYRFAIDSQLQRNVLRDPIWMNDPRFRFMSLFKRFGYRQFTYVKDRLIKEELYRGNIFPLLRLAVGGFAGGQFVMWGKDALRRGIFKAPGLFTDTDRNMIWQILDPFAAAGSIGVMSDIARLRGEDFASAWNSALRNGYFAVMPLAIAEVTGIPGSYSRSGWPELFKEFTTELFSEGVEEAWEKHRKSMLTQLTPLGGYFAAAIREKDKRRKALIKALRNR